MLSKFQLNERIKNKMKNKYNFKFHSVASVVKLMNQKTSTQNINKKKK